MHVCGLLQHATSTTIINHLYVELCHWKLHFCGPWSVFAGSCLQDPVVSLLPRDVHQLQWWLEHTTVAPGPHGTHPHLSLVHGMSVSVTVSCFLCQYHYDSGTFLGLHFRRLFLQSHIYSLWITWILNIYSQKPSSFAPIKHVALTWLSHVILCVHSLGLLYIRALYLYSSLGQEQLNILVLLSTKQELTNIMDFDSVITEFTSLKTRKIRL